VAKEDEHVFHRPDQPRLEGGRDRELKHALRLRAGGLVRLLGFVELLTQLVDLFEEGGDALDEPVAGRTTGRHHEASPRIGTSARRPCREAE
jgi:hypothetical protein